MTATWFEAKIKYVKFAEDGKERKVSETYLLDAVSYTDAESRITECIKDFIQGEFTIAGLRKSNVTEIVPSDNENDDRWYKAKVDIIDANEITGKEKKSAQYFLIAASNINTALENLEKSVSTYVVPVEINSLADTTILDVFPYFSDETNQKIPDNLKPLNEMEEDSEFE